MRPDQYQPLLLPTMRPDQYRPPLLPFILPSRLALRTQPLLVGTDLPTWIRQQDSLPSKALGHVYRPLLASDF
nr:hypothetical protein Iba_chr04eCG12790 [Ipomoea batatas]